MQIENDALADNCNVQAKKRKKICSLKDQENKKRKEQKRKMQIWNASQARIGAIVWMAFMSFT